MTHRDGFSLVEMLLATAIAALLMIGVLKVTVTLHQTRQRLEQETRQDSLLPRAAGWIERDLALCGDYQVVDDVLTLQTLHRLDRTSWRGTRQIPTRVQYRLSGPTDAPGGAAWLREQRESSATQPSQRRVDVLAYGIRSLQIRVSKPPPETADHDQEEAKAQPEPMKTIQFTLTTLENPQVPIQYTLVVPP